MFNIYSIDYIRTLRKLATNRRIYRVDILQSLSNSLTFVSLTFPDISNEYLRSIDPRNSSDTKGNAFYFSLQYSYILSQLRQSVLQ